MKEFDRLVLINRLFYSGNDIEIKKLGPKKYICIWRRQDSF